MKTEIVILNNQRLEDSMPLPVRTERDREEIRRIVQIGKERGLIREPDKPSSVHRVYFKRTNGEAATNSTS